jgi:thioredoxin reductase (NADPH)
LDRPFLDTGIDGNELIDNMTKQAERFGAELKYGEVIEVDLSKNPFTIRTHEESFQTKALIVATGTTASNRYIDVFLVLL